LSPGEVDLGSGGHGDSLAFVEYQRDVHAPGALFSSAGYVVAEFGVEEDGGESLSVLCGHL
jgi:hypothetical protein